MQVDLMGDGDKQQGSSQATAASQKADQAAQKTEPVKKSGFSLFRRKPKQAYGKTGITPLNATLQKQTAIQQAAMPKNASAKPPAQLKKQGKMPPGKRPGYIEKIVNKQKDYELLLKEAGIKKSPYDFVKGTMIKAIVLTAVIAFAIAFILYYVRPVFAVFGLVLSIAFYQMLFNNFLNYPKARLGQNGKLVERDILFAGRDLVISLRSGMPLFNAMSAVSTGYGAASREFGKVIELVQLGMPIEQAMDEVSSKSRSKTFKRIMLQASVSIKSGAEVTDAIQSVVEEVNQERVIELRRYGQRLNALAMFYMLFGVIFPSMGLAVATILTTFISIFTINFTVLLAALAGIAFMQIIFLNIMRTSRPVFAG